MLKQVISYFGRLVYPSQYQAVFNNPVSGDHRHRLSDKQKQEYTRRPKKLLNRNMTSKTEKKMQLHNPTDEKIIWMDLEMTGLDINKDVIMEIGCVITGPNLDELARHDEIVINVPGKLLDSMDAWCISTHGDSGLTEACRNSKLSTQEAEDKLLSFLKLHTDPGLCPLGGNSIAFDRMFLNKYMPRVLQHLHYRCIDVSTIKEIVRRWYPKEFNECPNKRFLHKTIADIEDSINELKYYRSKFFIPPQQVSDESNMTNKQNNS